MNIKTKITFTYKTPEYAQVAYNSLYPDNDGFIEARVCDNMLICYIENENIETILNSIEDLIHCEKVVEMTSEIV